MHDTRIHYHLTIYLSVG